MSLQAAWELFRIKFMYQGVPLISSILLGVLIIRFMRMCTNLYILYLRRTKPESKAKYRISAVQVMSWLFSVFIYGTVFVVAMVLLNVPIMSFVTPVAVIGAAVAFGAQSIVKDILSGFFVITEKQYGVGDIIRVSDVGAEEGITGTVEHVTLRATKMRNHKGELIVIGNGSIEQVANLTQEWSMVVFDMPLPSEVKPDVAKDIIEVSISDFWADEREKGMLISKPEYLGVESIEADSLRPHILYRITAKVQPGGQYETYRSLREHLMKGMADNGILVAPAESESGFKGGNRNES